MTITRWLQIKRFIKLNNNQASPKRGKDGYDPASKYDLIYKTIVDNTNAITESACLDLAGDEQTWGFQGYGGETVKRLRNKKVSKGAQVSILVDAQAKRY